MRSLPRKKRAPIPSDTDASESRQLWQIDTPDGRVEVLADECDVTDSGVIRFQDAPFGAMDGRRVVICVYSPTAWTRLIPPVPDFDKDDDDDDAAVCTRRPARTRLKRAHGHERDEFHHRAAIRCRDRPRVV